MKTDSLPPRTGHSSRHARHASLCLAALAGLGAAPAAHALADLGAGDLYLNARADITWDSNIFTNSLEQDDVILSLVPSLSYVQNRGLVHLTANASTAFREYLDYSDQSGADINLGFSLSGMHRQPAPATNFSLSGTFNDEFIASEEVATRIDTRSYGLSGTLDFTISEKTGLRLGAGWSRDDYDDAFFDDSDDYNGRVDFLYAYSEKLSLKAGYRYRQIEHQIRDYDTDTFIVGAEGVFSPKLKGSIEAGINDGSAYGGSSLYYSVGLSWAKDDNTSFTIEGSRDSSPSAIGEPVTTTDLIIGMSQRFTDSLSGAGYVGLGRFEREGALARDDDVLSAGASLSLSVGDNAALSASADYENRSSNSAFSDYDRIRLSLSGNLRF